MILKAFPSRFPSTSDLFHVVEVVDFSVRFPSTSDLFPAQEEPSHQVATHQTGDCKHPAHEEVLRGRGFDRHQREE